MKYNKHPSHGGVMKKKIKLTYKVLSTIPGTLSTQDVADIT